MKAFVLGYHDILDGGGPDSSGFPGATAARYKLDAEEFSGHLRAIAGVNAPVLADARTLGTKSSGPVPVILTFDDGGAGALAAADRLGRHGWGGHFLITVGRIGTNGFLDKEGVRDLRRRGHVVGSHSCTHPERMSVLTPEVQREEWRKSVLILSDMLGEQVDVASVPGGYYSSVVARTASASGIRTLFTSEPTSRLHDVDGCLVVGRYSVLRGMSPSVVAAIASGGISPRLGQSLLWNAKKTAKFLGGESYLKVRRFIISGGRQS
jgi:peptidoglycan/xylan/chitin deacetylase (PgdA/CDA1 family)